MNGPGPSLQSGSRAVFGRGNVRGFTRPGLCMSGAGCGLGNTRGKLIGGGRRERVGGVRPGYSR